MSWKDDTDIRVVTGAGSSTAVSWMIEDRDNHNVLGISGRVVTWGAACDGLRFQRRSDAESARWLLAPTEPVRVAQYVFSD